MSDEAAPENKPKKSKKGLLIIIVSAVVLIGGGAGAYFGFMRHPEEGAEAGRKEAAEPKLPAQFVAMDPPFVVNFEPGAAARFLQVAVQLKTRAPEMVEFLEHNTPSIRADRTFNLHGCRCQIRTPGLMSGQRHHPCTSSSKSEMPGSLNPPLPAAGSPRQIARLRTTSEADAHLPFPSCPRPAESPRLQVRVHPVAAGNLGYRSARSLRLSHHRALLLDRAMPA